MAKQLNPSEVAEILLHGTRPRADEYIALGLTIRPRRMRSTRRRRWTLKTA